MAALLAPAGEVVLLCRDQLWSARNMLHELPTVLIPSPDIKHTQPPNRKMQPQDIGSLIYVVFVILGWGCFSISEKGLLRMDMGIIRDYNEGHSKRMYVLAACQKV